MRDIHAVRDPKLSYPEFRKQVLDDYLMVNISRQCSLIGRKEVFAGKAKFGILGAGKEVAQVAMARKFREGDWRSGYYRDQTFMFATGMSEPVEFFAQMYGDTDGGINPGNFGRNFNNHYSTPNLNPDGTWRNLVGQKNTAADLSPTAAQLPRLLGLSYASKLFRNNKDLQGYTELSDGGNEVAFGMVGDASTSEGHFFEMMNAAGVLQVPLAIAVWDDGYGISVTRDMQTTKDSISKLLKGFEADGDSPGILIYKARGWDYPGLNKAFDEGIDRCREEHVPVLFHIEEMTQPQGHSTSGSHERYKSRERLQFEEEFDPIKKMKEWILTSGIAVKEELEALEQEGERTAVEARARAWENFSVPLRREKEELLDLLKKQSCQCRNDNFDKIKVLASNLNKVENPIRKDITSTAKKVLRYVCADCPQRPELQKEIGGWIDMNYEKGWEKYSSSLYNEAPGNVMSVVGIPPSYGEDAQMVPGREILRDNFDALFARHPLLVTFGEDTGRIGDVNQGMEGMQKKYGEYRVTDTGIRETTIIGQGIGMAMRGLRPIAEIQYVDYLLFGLQTLSDDLSTLAYRTKGMQVAPMIVRTRGHRLEGIWHSGSPMSMILASVRGIYICVPRDMTRAAGFYNTLLEGNDPAIVIEPLNGYRLKEKRPDNIGEFRVPLGLAEVLREGNDLTLVTYGSCVRIAQEAASQLREFGVDVELIDVQTLIPFDIYGIIGKSVRKTGKIVFFDEDVPGGASAYMMQQVLEDQGSWKYLEAEVRTVTARDHRPAYSTDGDYFSNPNTEDVFETVYSVMHDHNPQKYPGIY